eukprot:scaffold133371_cov15-Tisochrysis_lutea.AAC.2
MGFFSTGKLSVKKGPSVWLPLAFLSSMDGVIRHLSSYLIDPYVDVLQWSKERQSCSQPLTM